MTDSLESLKANGFEPSLHRRWYLDEAYFTRETSAIFLREWLCVGREEDWPKPGDHQVLELFGESILLLRNREGDLRGFYNVCRHRGAQLCTAEGECQTESGVNAKSGVIGGRLIRCPYHAWTYDLDGNLTHAPFMDKQESFDAKSISLHPVAVKSWGGFVFVNLTPESAPDFDNMIAGPAKRLARYPLAELRTGQHIEYSVAANWKVLCENYNECYHCGPVHPELSDLVPAFRENGGTDLDWERGIPHREGATTFTTSGETLRQSFPDLDADEKVRHKGELLLPNLFLSLSRDHVAAYILLPVAANHCEIRCLFLFEAQEIASPEFSPEDAVAFWDLINRQDWTICESVQRGMGSRIFEHGALSPMEDWSLDVRRYVLERTGLALSG